MENYTNISSDGQPICRYAVSIFYTTAMAIISLVALIGNILVIETVYRTPSLRTSTNFYYVNMAVSDFLACVTTWPLYLTDETITYNGSLLQGSLASFECKVAIFFRMVSGIVSVLSLVLIATDRFVATVFPLKAAFIAGKLRVALILGTWVISMAYCTPMFYYFKTVTVGQEKVCKFEWDGFALIIFYTTGLVLFEVLPFIAIIVLYSRIMRVLRERLNPACNTRSSDSQRKRNQQSQNIMKIFKSIVVMLFTWSSLFFAYLVLKMFSPGLFIKDKCRLMEGFSFYLIPLLSTASNPVILFAFSTNFRHTLTSRCPFEFSKICSCFKRKPIAPRQQDETLPELVAYKNAAYDMSK